MKLEPQIWQISIFNQSAKQYGNCAKKIENRIKKKENFDFNQLCQILNFQFDLNSSKLLN